MTLNWGLVMGGNYVGDQPLGHADAMAASQEWAAPLRGVIAPERFGLAKSALFALFRLTAAERGSLLRTFCRESGRHTGGIHVQCAAGTVVGTTNRGSRETV